MNHALTSRKIYNKIKEAEKVLVLAHLKPDGDTLGSVCAFIELLEQLGKNYTAFCQDAPAINFNYLPYIEKISSDKAQIIFSEYDLILALDCGDTKRTGWGEEIKKRRPEQIFIDIDHHPKVDDYADLEIKDTHAASTTEIAYQFFQDNRLQINKHIASCILTGISIDTGNFLYPSTSEKTLRIASEMILAGARMPKIIDNTLKNKSLAGIKVWGLAFSRLRLNPKYRLAHTYLTKEEAAGANEEDFEGLSNFLGNIQGVWGVMILTEKENNQIKGSLRTSHPTANLQPLAKILGGGGHPKACGFTVEGKMEISNNQILIK